MVDYFLKLPEPLIHHILSFIPFKEIGRICVLSKNWNTIWLNYPNLDFTLTLEENPNEQWRWAENSLSEFLVQKPVINELRLRLDDTNANTFTPKLDHWLGLAVDKNVSRLMLSAHIYSVPEQVLFSRTLEFLNLNGCTLEEDCFVRIELPRLETLLLCECCFKGDNLLQRIVDACPKMESLSIYNCYDERRCLSISCKPLKYFDFVHWEGLEKIEVNAPSLHTLSYLQLYDVPCVVDVTNCTNLKELLLKALGDSKLERVLSLFQGSQVLKCTTVDSSRKYKISCQSIEKLVLSGFDDFHCVEIDAPNVRTLEVAPLTPEQNFSCWNVPKVQTVKLCFSLYGFEPACRAGVEGLLTKLHNCKDLKFLISHYGSYMLLIENLHHVSFSSIDKLVKKSCVGHFWISTKLETSLLANKLASVFDRTLYIIGSSPQSIKSLHEKLSDHPHIQHAFPLVQLVTTDEEVEIGVDDDLKSLMGCHSTGIYHNAKIIFRNKN